MLQCYCWLKRRSYLEKKHHTSTMARMRFSRWDVVWLQNRPLIAGNVLHSWRRMRWKPIRNDRYPAGRLRMSAWPPRTNSPLRFPSPHLLLFSLQMKKQLEAFSPDRLLGYISKLMIYRTETDGKMEQEIDKCREVKREREGGQWLLRRGWIWIAVKTDSLEKKYGGDFN